MTKWENKGAAAKRSGRYSGMEQAWYAAKGKPKLSARDKRMGVTFSGKMVDAQQAFYKGYHYAGARNPACQGSGWKMNPRGTTLAFPTKAAAVKFARANGLKGFSIRKANPASGAGRGGRASGAGAGGAGGGAGAGSQGGTSRTEVRSPTRTATSTKAKTWGNITVTGGAGRGATTSVTVTGPKKKNPPATFYRFSGGGGTYQNIHTARPAAQAHADATGQSVTIQSAKGGSAWKHYGIVKPKRQANPLPVDRWVTVKARRLENGRIELRGSPRK
jgi:hypothetical protein